MFHVKLLNLRHSPLNDDIKAGFMGIARKWGRERRSKKVYDKNDCEG